MDSNHGNQSTLDYFTVQIAASDAETNLAMSREKETVLHYQV